MEHFDIAITNGLLLNSAMLSFSNGFVFLKDGKVVSSPGPEEAWEADQIIDAEECYVLPGLIDEHAHFDYQGSNLGVNADILCPPSGVTTAVDAGSTGCDNFDLFYRANISRYVTQVLSYINVSSYGVHCSFHQEENLDPRDFDVSGIEARFRAYPSAIRGIKIRLDQSTLGEKYSLASLEQCLRISEDLQKEGIHCPVIVHVANLPSSVSIDSIASLLRSGDIFVHVFQNKGETIFDKAGQVRDSLIRAKKRGVLFDACNGRIHWSFKNQEQALACGFLPDIISSDIVIASAYQKPGFSLVHAMNTFLVSGFDDAVILRAVTATPAKSLGLYPRIGSLEPGAQADVSIMKMDETSPVSLFDRWGGKRILRRYFKPMLTIKNGKTVFRQIDF